MKVLIIYCRFGDSTHITDFYSRVPLGIAYLGGVLRKEKFDVVLRDGIFYKNWEQFKEDLKQINPDVVGLSFTSSLKEYAIKYVKITKEVIPKTTIVAGGPHPTVCPEETIKELGIDFVVCSEGEKTFPELLNSIKNKSVKSVKGIAYRNGEKIKVNPSREMIQNLDEIPWPARDLLPMEKYLKMASLMPMPYPNTNILVSKGCPGNCLFCQPVLRKLTGHKVRYRSVENVIKEVKFLIDRYKIKSFDIGVDESTYDKEWIMKFCNSLLREKINIKWGLASRVDTVDEEMLKKMGKAGCVYLSYGIESGSQKMMNILRKGTKIEQAENALRWTEKAGICGRANLMIGSPGETWETIYETIEFIKRAKPDLIFIAGTVPLYGTDLYNLAEKENMLVETKEDVTDYDFGHLKIDGLSNEDLRNGLNKIVKAYKKNLFDPRLFLRKKHIYINIFKYFLSLLGNRKELSRIFFHYASYGKHIKTKN
ncbi:MAG: B12-binding domain-containing radical SAM protein [Nanoarchaeota archaeon]|nr:B12-binding domain-containing radical SAM protein [Nanoarchaeota archaeon]